MCEESDTVAAVSLEFDLLHTLSVVVQRNLRNLWCDQIFVSIPGSMSVYELDLSLVASSYWIHFHLWTFSFRQFEVFFFSIRLARF